MPDLHAAATFLATHARLLDRRRFGLFTGDDDAAAVCAALAGYRNPDGGYGSGLEPDMRSRSSQPVCALHAFGVFEEISPERAPEASRLSDWLAGITLPDGGLPFGLPMPDPHGTAPFFAGADPGAASLHMTSMLAAIAHRVAVHDPAVAGHDWLRDATEHAMRGVRGMTEPGHALELMFVLQFLDAVHDVLPEAGAELRRIGAMLPADGVLAVAGGADGEVLRPLDIAPEPDRPVRRLFAEATIDAELRRLAAGQCDDGGWTVDFDSYSAAARLEWRGMATVHAVRILRANGDR